MTKPNKTEVNYEELGRMLVSIYESGFASRKKMLRLSFLRGVVAGFGGVLGATILIAVLLWLLSVLDNVPLLGRVFENLRATVETRQ